MVQAYWLIGREIVEEDQEGSGRAEYGEKAMEGLSKRLVVEYGKGWSSSHLWHVRQFYLAYKNRGQKILHAVRAESGRGSIRDALRLELGWTHYRGSFLTNET